MKSPASDLSGSLRGIGIPALLRLLAAARDGGCLRVWHGEWSGEVYVDRGRVTGAALGADRGPDALDAMVLALSQGEFAFDAGAGVPPEGPNVELALDALLERLDRLERAAALFLDLGANVSLFAAVPRPGTSAARALPSVAPDLVAPAQAGPDDTISLDPAALHVCVAADDRRTVGEIAGPFGPARTVKAVAALAQIGVIELAAPDTTAPTGGENDGSGPVRPAGPGNSGGAGAPAPPSPGMSRRGASAAASMASAPLMYAQLLASDQLLRHWVRPLALAGTVLLLLALIRLYNG